MNDRAETGRESFEIGSFRPEDARGIAALYRSVYGEGYPVKLFYDPPALTAANEKGDYYSLVARRSTGKVGGIVHLFRSAPNPDIYESGAGLVLKSYRRRGLNTRLIRFQIRDWAPQQKNIHIIYDRAACNRSYTQKTLADLSFVATALEVAAMPAEVYSGDKNTPGRVASLFMARAYHPRPHTVHLPAIYERELRYLYSRLDDRRTFVPTNAVAYGEQNTVIDTTVVDFAAVARVAVPTIGADFPDRMLAMEATARGKKLVVLQVWLPLDTEAVNPAADFLHSRGYFFGGLLPQWYRHDALLMQRLLCPPDFGDIYIHGDEDWRIMRMVEEDWQRVKGGIY